MKKINIIDIGAVGGLEPPWSKNGDRVGMVLEFEPDGVRHETEDVIRLPYAIWSHDGEETLHFFRGGVGSASLKSQNVTWVRENFEAIKGEGDRRLNETWFARSECVREMPMQVRSLDSVIAELGAQRPDLPVFHFLKSDTQSGEYDVLVGAQNYLANECAACLLEVFRFPLLEGIRLADEIEAHMEGLGFEVIGWTAWQASFASQRDMLFARRTPKDADQAAAIELVKALYGVSQGAGLFSHKRSFAERVLRKARIALKMG